MEVGSYGNGYEIQATGPSGRFGGRSTYSIWKQPVAITLGTAQGVMDDLSCADAWKRFRAARAASQRAWRSR